MTQISSSSSPLTPPSAAAAAAAANLTTKPTQNSIFSRRGIITILCVGLLSILLQNIQQQEPFIQHILPNILFLFPYLCRLAPYFWRDPTHFLPPLSNHPNSNPKTNESLINQRHQPLREIQAKDYSYSYLTELSQNFYYPVVIRGLFQNTTALQNWETPGYLSQTLGDYQVSTNFCDAYIQDEVQMERFEDAYDHNVLNNPQSPHCLFFPLFSRTENTTTINAFKSAVTTLVHHDLELDRIRMGFGSKSHDNLHGCQMVMGRGTPNATPSKFTGLGWHAEPGTNWFVQVIGRKRWYFMDPKDSNLMMPFFETTTVFRTSDMERMNALHDRLPLYVVDLEPGDVLLNPDWWWHRTSAYPGLSVSVPMREVFPLRTLRNNPLYTMAIARFYLLKWGVN